MANGRCTFKAWQCFIILLVLVVVALNITEQTYLVPLMSLCSTSTQGEKDFYFSNERPNVDESFCPDDPDCFDKVWPELKEALCPAMVPQTALTGVIFALARDEVGLRQWNATDQSLEFFYRDSAYQTGFVYSSPENKILVYMSVWKAAHETVELWGKRNLGPLDGTFSIIKKPEFRKMLKEAKDPCIITVIRDPISHFLSGYNEVDTRIMEREYSVLHARMKGSPKGLFHRYHYGTKERFTQFVADILSQPYTLSWNNFAKIEPLHFYSMSGMLSYLAENGAKLSAFLPSIHNLGKELPEFAVQACPGILPENITQAVNVPSSGHTSSKDEYGIYQAAKDVWKEGGPTARALCVLHAIDYACWENLPDGIPALCKQVYSTNDFVERILYP